MAVTLRSRAISERTDGRDRSTDNPPGPREARPDDRLRDMRDPGYRSAHPGYSLLRGRTKGDHAMTPIPEKYLDLLTQKKAFAVLATTMPDGSPQVTPVWFDYKDGVVRVNTAKGRVKARNLKKDAAVALAVIDPDNPYRYIQI